MVLDAKNGNKLQDVDELARNNILVTTFEKLWNWGRSWSFWPLNYGCNCCPIEVMAAGAGRFDQARFGYEVVRAVPRQADLLTVAGPITLKMKPAVLRVWAQMPEPKWVIAMGNCAISGGPFKDGYSVLPGVDSIIPVDVYIPGYMHDVPHCRSGLKQGYPAVGDAGLTLTSGK
jgi:NADH-quinone oxidoreductase subunit B